MSGSERGRVAVVGAAGRFPGAPSLDDYWSLLLDGRAVAAEPDRSRRELWKVMDDPILRDRITTLKAGYIADIASFDADYFGISPREAVKLDPQQRLLLEVTHDALEDGGITRARLQQWRVGVFIGAASTDYMSIESNYKDHVDRYHGIGNSHNLLAGRISYFLNLKGPSLAIDTACSSSLTALHVALGALLDDEIDLAIVGGVNILVSPDLTLAFSQAKMLSPSGRCKTFAADADGYGRAEGAGVVLLRRLDEAEAERSLIRCVVRSSAINQDGRSNGITAPNGNSQVQVIRAALERAGVAPAAISYLEAHGTGTPLGDAIELGSLQRIFTGATSPGCFVGSAKASIGHAEAAAGICGFLKAMLILERGVVPPHPVTAPHNPALAELGSVLKIAGEPVPLPADQPCVGISSFGFGGSNAHAVIERHDRVLAGPELAEPELAGPVLLALSSHTADGLAGDARRLASFLAGSDAPLPQVAFTLQAGRDPLKHRRAHVVRGRAEAIAALGEDAARPSSPAEAGKPTVAFVFTGQGSQYGGMGRALHERVATFRDAFDECDRLIAGRAGLSIGEVLYRRDDDDLLLEDTGVAQLALFALEYALAGVWRAAGVRPSFAIGHSIGELVAHAISGALSLADAVALVHERGRLMQAAAHDGAMTSVSMDPDAARALFDQLGLPLHVAAVNGARRVVVSGHREAIAAFSRHLESKGIACRALRTRHAFHTPFFATAAAELAARSAAMPVGEGQIPVASNLDGALVPAGGLGAEYWARHITMPVEFARGVRTLVERGADLFLEIGPDRVLSRVIGADHRAVGTVSSLERGRDAEEALLRAAGALYQAGVDLDLTALGGVGGAITSIPPRGLARRRYWTEAGEAPVAPRPPPSRPAPPTPIHPAAAVPGDPDDSLRAVIGRQLDLMTAQLRLLGDL